MNNSAIVYTVTVIDLYTDKVVGVRRTPGVFTQFKHAEYIVRNNTNDLSDGLTYQYAVIEETMLNIVRPCIDVIRPTQWWYKYNSATNEFECCQVPPQLKNMCGFGIG